ncbi:SH3 domain-containing protein [Parerythrobacter aestuarii]|uniref:SH3 domain-containing protein n=1 Tax=Parerythrobacter aestuarii TaxID=3020909 RepID=UPI0024DE6999|nr:SH3 domain-containing protein [Parerythrobacter aestuarii]
MRIAGLIVASGTLAMASPALAEIPGPFVCSIGDVEAQLYANDDATQYSGEMVLGGDYGQGEDGEPEVLTLNQVYPGWRYVYANDEMTMVIGGDEAMLYGDFGESRCFASRSVPVGPGWQYGAVGEAGDPGLGDYAPDDTAVVEGVQVITRGEETWTESPMAGTAITWGGNVRAGPGTQFGRVAGVPLGFTVTLLARTDRRWLESDPWYKVRLPNGREGYIPGGLLCTRDGREGFFNQRNCEG